MRFFVIFSFLFLIDVCRLVIKTICALFVLLGFWFFFSDVIVHFLKMYPKWYRYYIFVLYFVYFLVGILFSMLSRKFREVFLEGVDHIIENFISIFFMINILNYFLISPYAIYYWYYAKSPIRWQFNWRRSARAPGWDHTAKPVPRRYMRKRKRGIFRNADNFDKGPWQIYSDRMYIPLYMWDFLEYRDYVSDRKNTHKRAKKFNKRW